MPSPDLAATGLGTFLQCQTKGQSTFVHRRKSALSSWSPLTGYCICTHLCRRLRKGVCSCQDVPLLAQATAALPLQPALCGQNCVLAQIPPLLYTYSLQRWKNLPMQCSWDNLRYRRSCGECVRLLHLFPYSCLLLKMLRGRAGSILSGECLVFLLK